VSWSDNTVWIDKGQSVGFKGVPEAVWQYHVGGYQVCEKWLKDRGPKKGKPGRTLSAEDIAHYQKIVVALSETIRIQKEIDEVIEQHGGWPGGFQGAAQEHPAGAVPIAERLAAPSQAVKAPATKKAPTATLFQSPAQPAAAPAPARTAAGSAGGAADAAQAILEYLRANTGMHGKSAIIAGSGIDEKHWNAAIKQLLDEGKVVRKGDKRGAAYGVAGKTNEPATQPSATRYSDEDLSAFRVIVVQKLEQARTEYDALVQEQQHVTEHPEMVGEDVGREMEERLRRQEKFIKHLEDALLSIRNKSYGICRITGKLINKERLRQVPHATMSIEAKQQMRG
jgi:RNA polymerase-binding transcription factor DksA